MATKTDRLLKSLSVNNNPKLTAIAGTSDEGMFLPNHSGLAQRTDTLQVVEVRHTKHFASIQAAIDSLPSTGGTVFIDAGTYNISSAITIAKNNVTLTGEGSSSIIYLSNNSNCRCVTLSGAYSGCQLSNFKINGNKANNTTSNADLGIAAGVYIATQTGFLVNNLIITEVQDSGIHLHQANTGIISNNYIDSCDFCGIDLATTISNVQVLDNHVSNIGMIGIEIGGASTNTNVISNNYVYNCTDNGIDCYKSYYNVISNNNIHTTLNGIALDSAPDNLLSNNHIYNSTQNGIGLSPASGGVADRTIIIGNRIHTTGSGDGIVINANDCLITDNYCYDYASQGIEISNGCTGNKVYHNVGTINDLGTGTNIGNRFDHIKEETTSHGVSIDNNTSITGTLGLSQPTTGAVVIGDVTGNARGTGACDIQSSRTNLTDVADGDYSTCIGNNNNATMQQGVSIGAANYNDGFGSVVIGLSNYLQGSGLESYSVCLGSQNYVANTAGLGYDTVVGNNIYLDSADIGYCGAIGTYLNVGNAGVCWAIGAGLTNTTQNSMYIGLADVGLGSAGDVYFPEGKTRFGSTTAPDEVVSVTGNIKASGYKSSDGTAGATGTQVVATAWDAGGHVTASKTITFKDGLITSIA